MHILLLETYYTGSHRQWAEGWRRRSRHRIEVLSLPGRHWKWRMLGGAVELARQVEDLPEKPDLVLASDMLDVSVFLGLTRRWLGEIPVGLYFHENQLTYPWSPDDPDPQLQRDHHYGFINYTSALAADRVFFNSHFHREAFLSAAADLLRQLPDYQGLATVETIRSRSWVLPLGLDLKGLQSAAAPEPDKPPLILWNHRWEYDKDPEAFFQLLFRLKKEGHSFRLAILGARFRQSPPVFEEARRALADEIVHDGYTDSREEYARWLRRADILPVTSRQDFFGISAVEAIACGCYPLLPDRLAFPEHIPESLHGRYLYRSEAELHEKMKNLLRALPPRESLIPLQDFVARYDWSILADVYDRAAEDILLSGPSTD